MRIFFLSLLLFTVSIAAFSQTLFDFYISNSGSNLNPGTSSLFSRKTLTGTDSILKKFAGKNGNVRIGLKSGDIFNEAFLPSYPLNIGTYYDMPRKKGFAVLNGSDSYDTGWVKVDSTINMFKQDIPLTAFTGNGINGIGQYSYVYIIEIDKELEKTSPITARKPLQFVNSLAAADTIAGCFYEPVTTDQKIKTVFVHPSNGKSPNVNSKYRYEVSTRGRAVNDNTNKNIRFDNLWVRGYGAGQGMLPGGDNSYYNKIIFGPGAAIHHVAIYKRIRIKRKIMGVQIYSKHLSEINLL